MKQFLIAAAATVMMLCPITAYGAPSEEALAVYQEMFTATSTLSDMNTYLDANILLAAPGNLPGEEETYKLRLEANTRLKNMKDLPNLQMHTFMRLSLAESYYNESIELMAYYQNGYAYLDDLEGNKDKTEAHLENFLSLVNSAKDTFDFSTYFMKDLTLRTEGDLRILDFTLDETKMNELLKGYTNPYGSMYSSYEPQITSSNLKGFYAVTPQGYLSKAYINMDLALTMYGETVRINFTGDLGVADPGQPVTIDVPNLKEYTEY